MREILVSVGDLVSFCHRRGDIDHRFKPSPSGEEGIAGHQRVYRRRGDSYLSEYPVKYRHFEGEIVLQLRGRADGFDPSIGLVEEIKTCRIRPALIPEAVNRMHLAQARLYAALIAIERQLAELEVRLTWFNIDTGEETPLSQTYAREELEAFLNSSLLQFSDWVTLLAKLGQKRDASLREFAFPHDAFRKGQREMAELVYKCVDQGGQLMLEAPTGIGKTAAVLYPALKALSSGKHERIAFVTAKTVGRRAVEDALDTFREEGLSLRALSLTAKERVCFSPGKACHAEECRYARGYYDRLPAALIAAMRLPSLYRSDIETLAGEFDICPYQLASDLLPWVDLVIADIHYVYSLTASVGSLLQRGGQRWSVLLDEAHNLPSRARHMFRASLAKADLMAIRRDAPVRLKPALELINRELLTLQRERWQSYDFDSRLEVPTKLQRALSDFVALAGEIMADEPRVLHDQPRLLDFYFEVIQFQRLAENWGSEFRFELSRSAGKQSLKISLNCLDPSRLLRVKQELIHSMTAFSATLSPPDWTRAALGLGEDTVFRRVSSPFDSKQLKVYLATQVDTRFRQREHTLPALAGTVMGWLKQGAGNCIIYFPSYRYLEDCVAAMRTLGLEQLRPNHWIQQREQEGDTLFERLRESRDLVAFCILGGVFGEGIDLPGEQLTSVVIVGVGLPQYNRDTEQLRAWYQQEYGAGFEYAYLYPGMQKVNQALGRVIRTQQDRGQALLVERRYREQQYRELLPTAWVYQDWDADSNL